jgi:hypothetical protein
MEIEHTAERKDTEAQIASSGRMKRIKTSLIKEKKKIDKQTVLTKLFAMKLEDVNMDPETWIINLQELQAKMKEMNERVSDGILIAHILANLPKEM